MEEKIRLAVFGQKRLSREGGIEIVVKELCTRMAQNGCDITCYNRAGHHVSGAEYDKTIEYDGMYWNIMLNYADLNLNQSGQYGQIYAEKFTSASLICKVFYGKMKAQWGKYTLLLNLL